jgi:hypothetical protein
MPFLRYRNGTENQSRTGTENGQMLPWRARVFKKEKMAGRESLMAQSIPAWRRC